MQNQGTNWEHPLIQQVYSALCAMQIEPVKDMPYTLLVGLSGGGDSVALCHVLAQLQSKFQYALEAIHINHQMRETAKQDEAFCVSFCASLQIRLHLYTVNVQALSEEKGLGLEEAGREARYNCYEKFAGAYTYVALGHHQNDQVETFMLNLMRGSGLSGLKGMAMKRGPYIRPFLNCHQDQLLDYLNHYKIAYQTDETNQDTRYTRNRIRHELIPYIETQFNPNFQNSVQQLMSLIQGDDVYMQKQAHQAFLSALIEQKPDSIRLSRTGLYTLEKALRLRLYRMVIAQIQKSDKDFTYTHYMAMDFLCQGQSGKALDLPKGLEVITEFDTLVIQKKQSNNKVKNKQGIQVIPLIHPNLFVLADLEGNAVGQTVAFKEGYTCDLGHYRLRVQEKMFESTDDGLSIKVGQIHGTLHIRKKAPGDRIFIKSMGGHKRLKKWFMEVQVPTVLRQEVLVLADDKQVYWVIGGIKADFGFEKDDKEVCHVVLENKKDKNKNNLGGLA